MTIQTSSNQYEWTDVYEETIEPALTQASVYTTIDLTDLQEGALFVRAVAEDLNGMAEDLQKLLIFEREAEKSKSDLITNIAHDLK